MAVAKYFLHATMFAVKVDQQPRANSCVHVPLRGSLGPMFQTHLEAVIILIDGVLASRAVESAIASAR